MTPSNPPPPTDPCLTRGIEKWAWNGAQWRELTLDHRFSDAPDACAQLALTFDADNDEMLGIGWLTNNETDPVGDDELNDLWIYRFDDDGKTFLVSPLDTPPRRRGAAMFHQQFFGVYTLMIGGIDDPGAPSPTMHGDAWLRTGPVWLDWPVASGEPFGRRDFAMAGPVNDIVTIVGGRLGAGTTSGPLTYLLLGGWATSSATGDPGEPAGPAMAYDIATGQHVLFGGRAPSSGPLLDDTWVLENDQWTLATTTDAPSPRWHHAMVYDENVGGVLLFGGNTAVNGSPSDESWVFANGDWSRIDVADPPEPRADHTLTWNPVRSRTVLIGGKSNEVVQDVAWVFDSVAWEPVSIPGLPTNTSDHAAEYDALDDRLIVFGGASAVGGLDVTYDIFHRGRPGHAFSFELDASGVDEADRLDISVQAFAGASGGESPTPVPGAALEVWDRGRFVPVDANTATVDQAGLLTWATGPQLPVDEAALLGRLMFRVVPVGENDVAPAEIATDYVELTLSYRLP
jgi:hypothetical protein